MSEEENVSIVLPASALNALKHNLHAFLAFLSSNQQGDQENIDSLCTLSNSLHNSHSLHQTCQLGMPVVGPLLQLPTPSPSPQKKKAAHINQSGSPSPPSHSVLPNMLQSPSVTLETPSATRFSSSSLSSPVSGPNLFALVNDISSTLSSNQPTAELEDRAESEEPTTRAPQTAGVKRKVTDQSAGIRPKNKKTGTGTTKRKYKPKKKAHLKTAQLQSLAAEATRQNKMAKASKIRVPDFTAEAKVMYHEMKQYLNHGTKLIYLSGTISPYILFLLASIEDAKSYLESNWDLMSGIGTELACERTPTDPHTQLIKLFINIRAYIGNDKSNLFFSFFCDAKKLHFHETLEITEYLQTRDTKWFEHSPPHQTSYDFLQGYKEDIQFVPTFLMDPLPSLVPVSIKEALTYTLILDQFKLGKQPNPFGSHIEDSRTWTAVERILAKDAEALESIEELEEFMLESLKDGVRLYEDYGYLDTDILEGHHLEILDRDGGTALYVVPGLRRAYPWLNEAITYKMSILEPGFRYVKDSEALPSFIAEQMILYNCYGARGHKDHPDIHPFFNHTIGLKKDPEGAKIRDTIFPIVFQVIQQAMSSGLLSEYNELEITVQELPFDTSSAARPFTGYIININVTTNGHLDINDRDLCVVVPFAEWEEGQIVFYQLGLVVDLGPLDIIIFPSNCITHFNLCHQGKCGSVVASTDKVLDAWVKDKNGYAGKNFRGKIFKWSNVLVITE
ncbi:hypothetical protein C8J56DRAFT_1066087 [Mycena floridula]|nr:hypothetical protein C8J56DRAFT_1066087 [Mycena floridula]